MEDRSQVINGTGSWIINLTTGNLFSNEASFRVEKNERRDEFAPRSLISLASRATALVR